jgi:MFS transporter, CP family, cyanate transporter
MRCESKRSSARRGGAAALDVRRFDPALLVVLGGISAALHVGKLPPALPVLREALGMTLVEAGFLLSLVQLAGMTLGLVVGVAADSLGLKRTMVAGLAVLSVASLAGGWATEPGTLMLLRAIEGFGFLLACMPAPGLIRRLVDPDRMSATLGLWGAYMPFGTAVALLCGPVFIVSAGWPVWWWLLAAASSLMALWLWLVLPADGVHGHAPGSSDAHGWWERLRQTLSSPGPWLVALTFAMYSSQWLAVIGFLPSMYAQAGVGAAIAGPATAFAAAVNMGGNIASGRLLQQGRRPEHLLYVGFVAMGLAGVLAFSQVWDAADPALAAGLRYAAVLVFSLVGGLIPGTLFSMAVQLAPGERTISTTVGWMQQWSAFGQFTGPPLVAWVATRAGGWQWSWLVTGGCAVAGLGLAALMGAQLRRPRPAEARNVRT